MRSGLDAPTMCRSRLLVLAASLAAIPLAGCASGPVVPKPPSVRAQLRSKVITPEYIDFVGTVVIENRMRADLDMQQVDYGAELHDAPLWEKSFDGLHRMRPWGTQTVTLPFRVPMQDISSQVEDVLAEESVRVRLTGTVVPVGWQPIAFAATKVIPVPRPPKIAFAGTEGDPLDGEFTVFLDVQNENEFPISCGAMQTWLKLNGKRYDLLRTEEFSELGTGERGRVALTMRRTRGKGISMIVNVLKNRAVDLRLGGAMSFRSPHGLFHLPVEVGPDGFASPPR